MKDIKKICLMCTSLFIAVAHDLIYWNMPEILSENRLSPLPIRFKGSSLPHFQADNGASMPPTIKRLFLLSLSPEPWALEGAGDQVIRILPGAQSFQQPMFPCSTSWISKALLKTRKTLVSSKRAAAKR